MSRVTAALHMTALQRPTALALIDEHGALDYATVAAQSAALSHWLSHQGTQRLALLADNSAAWALWDLAAMQAGITLVPLPGFFSDRQLRHVLTDAGIDTLISDDPARVTRLGLTCVRPQQAQTQWVAGRAFEGTRLTPVSALALPPGIAKVTYTSGTTGTPKGVLLTADTMEQVATSLVAATSAGSEDHHLALLPLATLLENIGGLYAPLLTGGCTVLYGQAHVGVQGANGVDPARILACLNESQATTAITLPQLLQALVAARAAGGPVPAHLRYLAVGGAPVSTRLLDAAQECRLPVFEGYGLSECASVVAVNRPGVQRPGSVGRPLPHARVRIADDGEILVGGALFAGYLHEPHPPGEAWPTGDLGYLDADGYLYLTGRKKNLFITAFGRNVAPEWVEAELTAQPGIAQAAVFGEARPFNVAVVVPRLSAGEPLAAALEAANRRLPDYAQVRELIIATAPFTPANGLATANGRLQHATIAYAYAHAIAACYEAAQMAP
jgi:long-subunit acyl-CoA synthetase (AMP-forming)